MLKIYRWMEDDLLAQGLDGPLPDEPAGVGSPQRQRGHFLRAHSISVAVPPVAGALAYAVYRLAVLDPV